MGSQRSGEGRQRWTGMHTRQCATHRSSWHRQETFTDPTLFSLHWRQVPRHSSPTRLPSGSHEQPMEALSSQHRVLVVCSVGDGSERSFLATGTGRSLLEAPAAEAERNRWVGEGLLPVPGAAASRALSRVRPGPSLPPFPGSLAAHLTVWLPKTRSLLPTLPCTTSSIIFFLHFSLCGSLSLFF